MGIVLADGTRLSARVWMPEDAGDDPVPAILEFLPYRKRDGTTVRDALTHPYFAGHGYACLRVDMRGNGDSDGVMDDEYSPQELSDACEVIAWIAAQPWCSGTVGMMGISWGGFNGLQVAALEPPALQAVVTLCSTVDRYADDIHFKGGCLLNENLGWGATMWAYSSRPPDPALREDWRQQWMLRLEAEPFLPDLWLRHQRRDAYWRHGSVCEDYSALKAKVMAVGGWGDSYKNAVPEIVRNLPGAKGIVGPWVHKYPHFAVPEPRIGFLQEALRWWDRWLKGVETGVEEDPALALYLMDGVRPATWYAERPGRWIAEGGWPSAGIGTEVFRLVPGELMSDAGQRPARGGAQKAPALGGGSGAARTTGPGGDDPTGLGEGFTVSLASPQHCGAEGGEFCAIWLGPEMPGDQRPDDAFSACFDSGPLAQTDIVGAPSLRLRLSSDRPAAQIAVRLNHVHPDGASTRITWGVLNLTRRDSMADPEPLVPGESCDITVPLDHIAYRLPEGHRLRVAVSTSYWPMLWPQPEAATLTLTGGALDLPVRPAAQGDEVTFPGPEAAPALRQRIVREDSHVRRTETDRQTGAVTLVIEDDFGEAENLDHGLISGGIARERWTIHPDDPLSARGDCHWTEVIERDGLRLRTETYSTMTSDATTFHFSARLEAWEGDRLIYDRDVKTEVPRDMM
ncbi:CocE/NonD family hydrolase [Oceanicola sp. 22II-s10i]|uniref:CocE/NonD family hydrolase n=1 Tax=Oceanicola sp. 22II-s10i TaxID=1317116 RepID=UPI0015958021|nr:CocE/NonD family hydrolase [Oceanicola sp. 22II-s10i]